MHKRLDMASSIMSQLDNVWRLQRLSLSTKHRIYSSLVQSVGLFGSETWTLRKVDSDRIQSFHIQALHHIVGIRWYDKISNMRQSGREQSYLIYRLSSLIDVIRNLVAFVVYQRTHLPRRHCNSTVNDAHTGTLAIDWKRPPGRPRIMWLQQVEEDCGISVDLAQITSQDLSLWRSLRPSAGQ